MEFTGTTQPQKNRFSDRLRERVGQSGKSQRFIARASGIEESTLSRFMLGKAGLRLPVIESLLATLELIETATVKK